MSIVFYEATTPSSAMPVACALTELHVPHERIRLDLSTGATRTPEYLQLNPHGKVPLLIADGTPMFEGLAIVLWLSERFGIERKVWPSADSPLRCEALAWSVWAYVSYGAMLGRHFMATGPRLGSEFHNVAQAAYTKKELTHMLDILDARLAKHPYLLGEAFSMADLITASSVGYGAFIGVSVGGHANVGAWLKRCHERPSFRTEFAAFR